MSTPAPANRARFSVDEILAITGGALVRRGPTDQAVGVSTDTRRIEPENVFVALKGDRFDGHEYLDVATRAGASVLVVSRYVEPAGEASVVRVHDTLVALGALARAHRIRWARRARQLGKQARVVGITGSAGKTTTARAVSAALEVLAPAGVHTTPGNLNNAVGVPLVLLGLAESHTYGVVEIGTNCRGEIAYGASLVEPDIALLTLVSCAHGEGIGTIDDIAREKGALLEAAAADGTAIANADDARARAQLVRSRARSVLTYGQADSADVRLVSRQLQGAVAQRIELQIGCESDANRADVISPLLGEAGAYAVAAAAAVALAERGPKQDWQAVAAGLGRVQGEHDRLQPKQLPSGVLLIDDSYNANPASMQASIRAASELAKQMGRPLVLVLGEMRELGAQSAMEHDQLGTVAAQSGAAHLIAVAGWAQRTAAASKAAGLDTVFVPDAQGVLPVLVHKVSGNPVVLIKGSRGVALERAVEGLIALGGKDSP